MREDDIHPGEKIPQLEEATEMAEEIFCPLLHKPIAVDDIQFQYLFESQKIKQLRGADLSFGFGPPAGPACCQRGSLLAFSGKTIFAGSSIMDQGLSSTGER
ncbi:MAG TPA: hypothetical protein PLY52_04495 [Methanothrix sp.]|jgi:hypothetical protein|uniref:hypothetical protein n=1 Tax=Methanothrix sp. TaxID=90426 RepID=UPI002BA8EDD0|nr:hypothetical protein [Methanothrix sp.]MDI9418214.1 hypothetical protein [Euryarchaeota archaeon]HON35554.1 hypothetical protein [Methanothrix sp.]HRU74983.1 hypothetical protein [Methanothrix sp.]